MSKNQSAMNRPAAQPALWQQLQWTARLVRDVQSGRSLAAHINDVPPELRSGVQALTFDVMRHLGEATAISQRLVARQPPPETAALLVTALAIMLPGSASLYSVHTLGDQAVEAAKRQRHTRHQAGLINACMRRFARERDALLDDVAADPVARWNYPLWWIDRVRVDLPNDWQSVLAQAQTPAPMVLRVNRLRTSVPAVLADLGEAGIGGTWLRDEAIILERPTPVAAIPGFAEGLVSVQSAAAQRAAHLLMDGTAVNAACRVLDACAAPGGKTAHLLELSPDADVAALEVDPERAQRIASTLRRLGLQAEVTVADAADVAAWWDGRLFDRILLDAPCSASGIVRRHPDIRWLRRVSDIAQLAEAQERLLTALWPLLAQGGRMLYATCSVFHQEGEERIHAFLSRHADAHLLPSPGHMLPCAGTASDLAGENARCDDGFFYALLAKRAA